MSFGAPRGTAFTVSGWEARFRASAIRDRHAEEARLLLDRASELGGDEVRAQAREDPDLASLRTGD